MSEIDSMDLTSKDLVAERIDQLCAMFPEIVTIDNMRHARYSRNPAIARVFTAFE